MSAIDNYGDFELPEEKSEIEVVEDPVKAILSIYELYNKIAEKLLKSNPTFDQFKEKMYAEAENIFKDKKININKNEIKEIIKNIIDILEKKECWWGFDIQEGIFLSAVHNFSSLETLVIEEFTHHSALGYKLKSNKKLVLGPKIQADYIGEDVEGGIILNYGNTSFLGNGAKGGIQIHKGPSQTTGYWKKGIQMIKYHNKPPDRIKNRIKGICYLPVLPDIDGRLRFEYGNNKIVYHGVNYNYKGNARFFEAQFNSKKKFKDKINSTLNTPELLAICKEDSFDKWQELLKKVASFDWQKLQNDLSMKIKL